MYRVLIADDEEIERLSFSRKLKKYFGESCEVFHAENGMQAILAVDKNDTPIVIMDIGMPGMNGVEAAEWIRKSHPDCVIIFLTCLLYTSQQTVNHLQKYINYINGLAYRDGLTGVKNKTAYQETVIRLEEQTRIGRPQFAVVVFDINGLKEINDTNGHDFGDMLIIDEMCIRDR